MRDVEQFSEKFQRIVEREKAGVILFIAALIFIIVISHPQILLNDEWITTNQLAQLHSGSQFILNEGKYGTYENGTPFAYFEHRNNILGYPLFLPLISLPALHIITLFGDTFDYWMITGWTLLVILLALLIRTYYPEYAKIRGVPWTSFLIIIAFVLFIVNILYYVPFYISPPDAPREVAALILTNNLLFAGMAVAIYATVRVLSRNQGLALLGTVICMGSSSYFIWASSAKDHMLQAFLVSLIVFGIVSYLYSGKYRFWFLSFFFVGLLAWDRPEMGIPVLLSVLVVFALLTVRDRLQPETKKNLAFLIMSPFFTLIGALPLLINNYLVSGNPLVAMYTIWSTGVEDAGMGTSAGGLPEGVTSTASQGITSISSLLIRQVTPQFDTLPRDLFKIMLFPENGSIGILMLTPFFIIGLLAIPFWYPKIKEKISKTDISAIISLAILAFGILISFARSFPGVFQSMGIGPDIRYLCPIYIPLNLIGIIVVFSFLTDTQDVWKIIRYVFILSLGLLVALTLGFFIVINNDVDFYLMLARLTTALTIGILVSIAACMFILFLYRYARIDRNAVIIVFSLLIALPLIWQLGTVFLTYTMAAGLEGYTFWLPFMRKALYGLFELMLSYFPVLIM
ncbi:hypothetical protein ASZ90_016912 [hydrocarbon metagenome]|uniref:Uncharacterized protein n=1 Tax=hydrocarbon metagenome TaxID=938273 RepID=A0A0W8EAI1_9ZZZZ